MEAVDTIIGVDPGKAGAIAILCKGKYRVHKMPGELQAVDELLKAYKEVSSSLLIIIEQIRLHRSENMAQVSRMQKMFENYNQLKALFIMNELNFVEASPKTWQSFLGLRTKQNMALERHQRKRVYRDFAAQWWPEKLSIQVGDAVCLLIYGQRNLKFNPEFGQWSERLEKLI